MTLPRTTTGQRLSFLLFLLPASSSFAFLSPTAYYLASATKHEPIDPTRPYTHDDTTFCSTRDTEISMAPPMPRWYQHEISITAPSRGCHLITSQVSQRERERIQSSWCNSCHESPSPIMDELSFISLLEPRLQGKQCHSKRHIDNQNRNGQFIYSAYLGQFDDKWERRSGRSQVRMEDVLWFSVRKDSMHSSLVALDSFLFVESRDMEVALNKIGMSVASANWMWLLDFFSFHTYTSWFFFLNISTCSMDKRWNVSSYHGGRRWYAWTCQV